MWDVDPNLKEASSRRVVAVTEKLAVVILHHE